MDADVCPMSITTEWLLKSSKQWMVVPHSGHAKDLGLIPHLCKMCEAHSWYSCLHCTRILLKVAKNPTAIVACMLDL